MFTSFKALCVILPFSFASAALAQAPTLGLPAGAAHPSHLMIAPNVATADPTLAKKSTHAWPAADCLKLQSLGAPAPAWQLSTAPAPSQDALLMLINYQMALSLCQQQEQHKMQKEHLSTLIAQGQTSLKMQQEFQGKALALLERQHNAVENLATQEKNMDMQADQKLQELVQLQDLTQNLLNKTLMSIIAQQQEQQGKGSLTPQGQYIIQDTSLPPLERTLLRLIEVLEKQSKNPHN